MNRKHTSDLLVEIAETYNEAKQNLPNFQMARRNIQLERDISWSHWYEVSEQTLIQIMLKVSGLSKAFDANQKKTPIEWIRSIQDVLSKAEPDFTVLNDDVIKAENAFIELIIALNFNQAALEQRNKSISEMISAIKDKSDNSQELVLEAISIDPSVMSNLTIEKFIREAAETQDQKFLSKIPNAMMKKAPRPRQPEFDQLRWFMRIIADMEQKENPSLKAIEEANDILKLMRETEDTVEAIRHHIKVRREDRGSL